MSKPGSLVARALRLGLFVLLAAQANVALVNPGPARAQSEPDEIAPPVVAATDADALLAGGAGQDLGAPVFDTQSGLDTPGEADLTSETIEAAAASPPGSLPVRTCSDSLQARVDAAPAGSAISVGGSCAYRETVTITKPLTLVAMPGTEIRGSDVWTGWTRSGAYWVKGTLPAMAGGGECQGGSDSCRLREQAFIDGRPLAHVAANPTSGQFAVDADRRVLLSDDPTGHTVEVSTRTHWIVGQSDNVTIQGWRMLHAANDAQTGALTPAGYSNWTIRGNVLSDAHGAVVEIKLGTGHRLLGNDISRGGQLGVMGGTGLVQANRIHDNNVAGFDAGWEAGGLKAAGTAGATWDGNVVDHNNGPGLWCDIHCLNVTISNNRVHHNLNAGIFFEISSGARIVSNAVWENGWGFPAWGWGGGIILSSSADAEVAQNVVAWNADGISVISQDRPDGIVSRGHYVHDNTIATTDNPLDTDSNLALGWLQDWSGGMFDPTSNNRGQSNLFWYPAPEPGYTRFAWNGPIAHLADLNATLAGGGESRYLTATEKDRTLTAVSIPLAREPR